MLRWRRWRGPLIRVLCGVVIFHAGLLAWASEYHGQVFFSGQPVPGATVTVTQGSKRFQTVTDLQGLYEFPNLADGAWKIQIEMRGFSTVKSQVIVAPNTPQGAWELKLLGLAQMLAKTPVSQPKQLPAETAAQLKPKPEKANAPQIQPSSAETTENESNGLLINGSVNNAATSKYTISPAFGNRRPGRRGLYTGGIGAIVGNSVFDARPYSLTGLQVPKDSYSRLTTVLTLGGPLDIPHLMWNGPDFFVAYQRTREGDAAIESGLVPTTAERSGDLSGLLNPLGQPVTVYDPATGLPFTGPIPVSPQAQALLNLYPLPDLDGNSRYNYQTQVLNDTHLDALQSRLEKTIGHRDDLYGGFGFLSSREDISNLFHFRDTTDTLGIDVKANWSHVYLHQFLVVLGYHFTRLRTQVQPEFANRENISGNAGIFGNDQDPTNWGPPALVFSSGIAMMSDADSEFNRNRTDALSVKVSSTHGRHTVTFGGDFRRQEFNEYTQQNPRGTFTFTGAATQGGGASATSGSDLADFLLGIPDTSALAYGNPDKYFRQSVYDLYITDEWRARPELTINAGMRWDYGVPLSELFNRLVNLDVTPGFAAVAPVLATNPVGPLTGMTYPNSLVRGDWHGFEPRIGIAWRPLPASTLVIRGGYGIYDDTSVYLSATEMMAQQAPLSTSISVANSSDCALTLAHGFLNCAGVTAQTFGIDPNFRVGYAQIWQLQAQRDLPGALVMTATYLGIKGTHGMQQFLPNTYPIGAANPCTSCQAGFIYRTSNGNSTREAGQIQLRRRLRSGFTASIDYTYAKAIDDDAQVGAQGHVAAQGTGESLSVPTPA
ncbi:MAG: TonB-dependent receptor, partial [Acidobacteriaceae bacterium]